MTLLEKVYDYKFRCSALGNIVTKSGKLTDGAKTYITECFIELKDGVRREAYGKALDKGIATEQDIIQLINDTIYRGEFVGRVQESKDNDWIKGTADVNHGGYIYDCKSAFDRFTFAKAELSHLYEWQLKGYCMLYGKDKARLFYGLVNMPDYMILDAQRALFYRNSGRWLHTEDPEYLKACDELEAANKYDDLELWERFKVWEVPFTESDTERIIESVKQAREYMIDLYAMNEKMIANNKQLMGI